MWRGAWEVDLEESFVSQGIEDGARLEADWAEEIGIREFLQAPRLHRTNPGFPDIV